MFLSKQQCFKMKMWRSGVTFIEIILVVAIITVIGTMTAPFASQLYQRISLENDAGAVVAALHKAQANSLDGKGDAQWGVCLTGAIVRVYRGSCVSPTEKEDWSKSTTTTITGLADTQFSRLRGEPTAARTITVSNLAGSRTVTINLGGGIY